MKSKILIFSLFSSLLFSQSRMNLDFENVTDNNKMLKWFTNKKNQTIEIDSLEKFSGKRSLKIEGENKFTDDKNDIAIVMQKISKNSFNAKEITLKARIKSKSDFDGVAFPYIKTTDKDRKLVTIRNLQDKPIKGNTNWEEVVLKLPILENAEYLDFGFIYKGKGSAWFDNVEILVDGKSIEKPFKELSNQEITAIKKYVYPLSSFEPNNNNSDLKILRNLIGSSKVVALGESTHGSSEIYKMKDRLIRYLAENENFDIFSIEAQMQQSYLVEDYTNGKSTLKEAMRNLGYWTWKTKEMASLLNWMKDFNKDKKKISFTGFDMQSVSEPIKQLRATFKDDKELQNKFDKLSLKIQEFLEENRKVRRNYILTDDQSKTIYPILSEIKSKITSANNLTESEKKWQNQNVRIIEQILEKTMISRDKFMAENFMWIKNNNANSKFIVWAHNGHINKDRNRMGGFLDEKLKNDYVTFGFAFFDGTYKAINNKDLGNVTAQTPYLGTYEYWLNSLNEPYFILDIRKMKEDKDLKYLLTDFELRTTGSTKINNEFGYRNLAEDFDYLIFINKSTNSDFNYE